jgi:hypothetical protein
MNTKTTVVLLTVIVAAVLVVYLMNQPKAAPKSSSNTIVGQGASVLGGLFNLGAALVAKSGSKPSAPSSVTGSAFNIGPSNAQPGVVYGQGYSSGGETLTAGSAADMVQISPGSED